MEKLNDVCRRIHLQKSNKWDATKDVLMADQRLEALTELQRTPRSYKKKADEYWSTGIRENRQKRPRLCNEEANNSTEDSHVPQSMSTFTPDLLRSRLKDLGIKTRVRKLESPYDMYCIALNSQEH